MKTRAQDKTRSPGSLWAQTRATITCVLLIDLAGLVTAVAGTLRASAPTTRDWWLFAALLTAGLAYTQFTRPAEERRRGADQAHKKIEHVDQTSIWFASAGLVLPAPLAVVIVIALRSRRYLIARKPAGTFISSTATMIMSTVGVGWLREAVGGSTWVTGHVTVDAATSVRSAIVLLGAIVVYNLAQTIPVGIYRGIRFGAWTLEETVGSLQDNLLIIETLLLAMLTAVTAATMPVGLALMLALAVRDTRQQGRIAVAEEERKTLRSERDQAVSAATTDHKTGLLNPRGFDLFAGAALEVDQACGDPTSVLMLDLDHFKRVNDTLGHYGGDLVLKAVATILRRELREKDVACRFGGEELCALLPNTGLVDAIAAAERVRHEVEQLDLTVTAPAGGAPLRLGVGNVPRCTVSIGVATSRPNTSSLTQLMTAADTAVYEAKNGGRNRVVAHDPWSCANHGSPEASSAKLASPAQAREAAHREGPPPHA